MIGRAWRRETEELLEESRKVARILEKLVNRLETYTDLLEVELERRDPSNGNGTATGADGTASD